ncbi:MAG TPA: hypothetical protein VN578_01320 [Candidatus Binatia bacterium]|jgi:hypothetical protein|nr:hypothetical protein [Candidatus Binatia bacterium]
MTNASSTFRALVIYALVLPVALVVGYMVAVPADLFSMGTVGLVLAVLITPLLLRYHHPLLFLSWNMSAVIFFLPGHPEFWVVMAFVSLIISIVQRTIVSQMRFVTVSWILLPLMFLLAVVCVTARLTGGIGLNSLGADTIGGRRYIYIFAAIAGFLAMAARRIPPEKVRFYVGLYFLAELTNFIGTTAPWAPPWLYYLYVVFPVDFTSFTFASPGQPWGHEAVTRLYGASVAALGACNYLLARFGVRGLLEGGHLRRLVLFVVLAILSLLGGFRTFLILLSMTVFFAFYFERMFRPKYLIAMALLGILGAALVIPLANKLPISMQRALSFLPLDIGLEARESAQTTVEWRLQMWEDLLPEIPKYLLVGKGLAIDAKELAAAEAVRGLGESESGTILVGDYHSGPLSVIIPFGVFGMLGFIWLMAAIGRALYLNHRFGDPALQSVNTLLFVLFLARVVVFIVIFGGFYTDLAHFLGLAGLSIAINGGVHRPERVEKVTKPIPLRIRPAVRHIPEMAR